MKAVISLLALVILGASAAAGQTSGANHPIIDSWRLQVLATMEPASAKAGTPIIVKLVLRSVWYRVVNVSDISPGNDYELVVVDSSGNKLSRTRYGDQLFRGEYVLLHTDLAYIEPGQEIGSEIDVTKIFQLDQPGIYYLWAIRGGIWPDPDDFVKPTVDSPIEKAFSNPVRFAIVR